jgi:hypothetical protein
VIFLIYFFANVVLRVMSVRVPSRVWEHALYTVIYPVPIDIGESLDVLS